MNNGLQSIRLRQDGFYYATNRSEQYVTNHEKLITRLIVQTEAPSEASVKTAKN